MSHDHTPAAPRQPLSPTSHDPVADYLEFLEKISEDVDQIPDQKVDERARQLFGQSTQPNGLPVRGTCLEDTVGSGRPQRLGVARLLETITKTVGVLKGRPPEWSDGLAIVADAQREADRIRRTAHQEAPTEAAHPHAGAEHTDEALTGSTHKRIALPRRLTAKALTVPASKIDADGSASRTERGPEASRDARWLDEDAGAIVPVYLLTRGRTAPARDVIDLIAVIITSSALTPPVGLGPEHLIILQKCTKPTRLVDVAAELNLPIGVARVLVGDLHAQQLVQVKHPPPAPDANALAEVISNLSAL